MTHLIPALKTYPCNYWSIPPFGIARAASMKLTTFRFYLYISDGLIDDDQSYRGRHLLGIRWRILFLGILKMALLAHAEWDYNALMKGWGTGMRGRWTVEIFTCPPLLTATPPNSLSLLLLRLRLLHLLRRLDHCTIIFQHFRRASFCTCIPDREAAFQGIDPSNIRKYTFGSECACMIRFGRRGSHEE
ncbi:hypothetical protein EJ05DRAFT_498283 [Pseudovirgaria hyperparasitica]|uniref:Uncharacterized protein n=1 Tax=Pseudovirgaria hyperparasitica TaxID=470096 RepID=A0A6A6WC87_9PEZI|nr:uncharacterized protein EJ05DRAFT_498283 [Pseudovirgaria hyperparasitica]KAF2760323.1 hypothetical protein EJ05DRAFT_498283 [Pseudovirgaria hyperparasitica]